MKRVRGACSKTNTLTPQVHGFYRTNGKAITPPPRGTCRSALDCDSHRTLRHAVKNGKGVGFSYREYLAGEIKLGEVKVLNLEGFNNSYDNFVIHAKDRPLSEAAEKFLALLRRRKTKSRRTQPSRPTAA